MTATTYHKGQRDFGTGYDMINRILALEAAIAWQTIETAPNDGRIIVAVRAGADRRGYSFIFWDAHEGGWSGYTAEDEKRRVLFQPTHWMPLPEPPQ